MPSGITTDTVSRMVIDAAAVFINYGETDERLLGATREGATFTIEQDVRVIPIDGVRGPLKGARRVINENARITANLLEMTAENFQTALFGSVIEDEPTDTPTHDAVRRTTAFPAESEYFVNVALVGTRRDDQEDVILLIKNGLAEGNVEIETTEDNEASMEVTFAAHFDPANLTDSPYEIRIPKQS